MSLGLVSVEHDAATLSHPRKRGTLRQGTISRGKDCKARLV
jgi:hypothetical protein